LDISSHLFFRMGGRLIYGINISLRVNAYSMWTTINKNLTSGIYKTHQNEK
jgi:hypothetical protein